MSDSTEFGTPEKSDRLTTTSKAEGHSNAVNPRRKLHFENDGKAPVRYLVFPRNAALPRNACVEGHLLKKQK